MSDFNPDITYDDLDTSVRLVGDRIKRQFDVDCIIAVGRGGLILAGMLAYHMQIENVRHLDLTRKKEQHEDEDTIVLRAPFVVEGKFARILIVDDIACKGQTLKWIHDHKETLFYCNSGKYPIVRYFTLFHRTSSQFEPDYYCHEVDHGMYIDFPWDYDGRDEEIPF